MSILTLVAAYSHSPLSDSLVREAASLLTDTRARTTAKFLSPEKAASIQVEQAGRLENLRPLLDPLHIDAFLTRGQGRRKKLLLADMDATIVKGETLDELAGFAGLKDEIASITALAMEGRIDFETALRQRVALLKGLDKKTLHETLDGMTLNDGAKILVGTMKKKGATCVLVSGGFTFFTHGVAAQCGFDFHHGNHLDIEGNVLNGTISGPILDKNAKLDFLRYYCAELGIEPSAALTIGDGANDIPMLEAAGLGIGYHPKDAVAGAVPNLIRHGDLTAALYAQGYADSDFL